MKNQDIATWQVDRIPVYSKDGQKQMEIRLPEKIMPIATRRGGFSETGIYYKGSGIVYQSHLVNEVTDEMKFLSKTHIIYEKYLVCYPHLAGRYGIFLFPHQAVFADCEGGCGKKEQKLLHNQELFERTAIEEITDVIPTGIPEHNIYAYRLKEIKGSIDDTILLMEYIMTHDLNTAWDKNLWGDIYAFGYVRDVADWFLSGQLNHKVGTIYALLNSLYRADIYLYALLLQRIFGKYSLEKYLVLYYSARIVEKYCAKLVEAEKLDLSEAGTENYERLFELLFSGKACCHLEDEEKWRWVYGYFKVLKEKYLLRMKNKLDNRKLKI